MKTIDDAMTPKQRIHLQAQLWPDACAAQGWNPKDREKRLYLISRALGRVVASANEIGGNKEFDAVKKELLAISRPADLDAQIKMENMPRTRMIKKLEEYPEAYLLAITQDKFRISALYGDWRRDLSETQLKQLLYTLAARAQARRHKQPANVKEAKLPNEKLTDHSPE